MNLNLIRTGGILSLRNGAKTHLRGFSSVKETHFGYENVSEEEKGNRVHSVFSSVADKYDLMNDVMSGGVHRLWKDHFVHSVAPIQGASILDVAGGTGDIAFRCLEYIRNSRLHPSSPSDHQTPSQQPPGEGTRGDEGPQVTVLDVNEDMLNVGKSRALNNGYQHDISWVHGDAESLPFTDASYDLYTVAYGVRNMTHVHKALSEAYRVLKPGGRFACLEFSRVNNFILRRMYDTYSFNVIPVMGKLVAGDFNSYKYLVQSIRKFPGQEEFSEMIREAGFKGVHHENLFFGVSAIHSAFKI